MNEIVFVTHNKGKVKSAEKYFSNLKFSTFDFELDEPRSDDIKEIATAKVKQAYSIVKKPCIALDTGFFIEALNGFPRAFVNFSLDTIGIEGILKLMQGVENRKCKFEECLAYHDGKEIHYFYGKHPGNLEEKIQGKDREEKWSDLWYIFKPEHFDKTLAEMNQEERENRRKIDGSVEALKVFAKWYEKENEYQEIYNKHKKLIDIAIEKTKLCEKDPLHFIGHTIDVINYEKELLETFNADKEVCIISAYWHDVGRSVCDKGHEEESGKILKEEMKKLNYNDDMIEKCYLAVINHKRKSIPPTIEGKILRDADKIAYIGKNRWDRCMKENMHELNEIVDVYLPILRDEILRFEESRKIFDRDMNNYVKGYLEEMKKGI